MGICLHAGEQQDLLAHSSKLDVTQRFSIKSYANAVLTSYLIPKT